MDINIPTAYSDDGSPRSASFRLHKCYRSSQPMVFLGKDVLKQCSKFQENTHTEVRFQ